MNYLQTILNDQKRRIESRSINLDVIRTFAILFVICVHFLLKTGFYEVEIYGMKLELMTAMRSIFICCVPLFLLLTGYLNKHKEPNKKYYFGLLDILVIYSICSIVCYIFLHRNTGYSIIEFTKLFFSFQAAPYAWYVNLYFGLYLLIPYLNRSYDSLNYGQKKILVVAMVLISIFPSFSYLPIFPNYWSALWPLAYYFTGKFLRDLYLRKKNESVKRCFIVFVSILIINLGTNMILNYGRIYWTSFLTEYFAIGTYFLSTSLFYLLLRINFQNLPMLIKRVFYLISKYSFGMYLISACFDNFIYTKLNEIVLSVGNRLYYFFGVILFVVLGSFISSVVIENICAILMRGKEKMGKKKLIFFARDLRVGGIENSLIELLKNINYNKYQVTLVLEKKMGQNLERIPSYVRVIEYKLCQNDCVIIRKLINFAHRLKFIFKYYHRYDFSCSYATYSIPGSILARISSKNNSLYVHSNYALLYSEKDFNKFFDKLKVNYFKTILFVSNESRESFINRYPCLKERTIVCNNFIDYKKIQKLAEIEILPKKKKKILFSFVGRLDESSKALTRLILLIQYLAGRNFSVECWIIGDGPDKAYYEALVKEKKLKNFIRFFGNQQNPYPYLKKANYVILTSKYEGFPVVFLESIVLNKKIISTVPVSDEFISIPNRFGYIISNDSKKINKEVEKIITNDNLVYEQVDFEKINQYKISLLEKIFDQ